MIVQAVDGRYYQEPTIVGPNWLVRFQDGMPPQLVYKCQKKGTLVSWKTARKVLRPAGVKANCKQQSFGDYERQKLAMLMFAVLSEKFVECTVYELEVKAAIPVPDAFSAVLMDRPADGDFEIMDWR